MYTSFLTELISNLLGDLCRENDLANKDEQMKRCIFLIALFSDYYDNYRIDGICKYDYLFLISLIELINELTNRLIIENEIKSENYYRLIYLMDKITSNWLDLVNNIDKRQFNRQFLFTLRNQLTLIASSCKNNFKLISLLVSTVTANIRQIENAIESDLDII